MDLDCSYEWSTCARVEMLNWFALKSPLAQHFQLDPGPSWVAGHGSRGWAIVLTPGWGLTNAARSIIQRSTISNWSLFELVFDPIAVSHVLRMPSEHSLVRRPQII